MASEPDSRQLKTLYAATCVGLGEHERAIGIYRELCVGGPTDAEAHLSIGHAQKTLGQSQAAIESYRRAAALPRRTSAMPTGASPISRPTASRTRSSRACAPRRKLPATALVDRYHLCFALGKALEDRGEFAAVLPATTSAATR